MCVFLACIFGHQIHAWVPTEGRGGYQFPGTVFIFGDLSPLEEPVLLTAVISQPTL